MNKKILNKFSIFAKKALIENISYAASKIGVSKNGIFEVTNITNEQIHQRQTLIEKIKSIDKPFEEAFEFVVEEIAYTWFSYFIAIRFMEINNYLPSKVRILSSTNAIGNIPECVLYPFKTGIEFTGEEAKKIECLLKDNELNKIFRLVFIRQCNMLSEILPEFFYKFSDYEELLFDIDFSNQNDVVYHLIHDIPEEYFDVEVGGQVEVVGWLHQYYNTEARAKARSKTSNKEFQKEEIACTTQFFTPNWIVRYLVQNSLGRVVIRNLEYADWKENEKENIDYFKMRWEYYLDEVNQPPEIIEHLRKVENQKSHCDLRYFTDITFLEPCMGTGHILVYAFDLFMSIYWLMGHSRQTAVKKILQHNLYGVDIDDRAKRFAYFTIMMKARYYDCNFFDNKITPNLCAVQESNNVKPESLELFGTLKPTAKKLVDTFKDAKEYGSMLNVSLTADEITQLENKYREIEEKEYFDPFNITKQKNLTAYFAPLIRQAKIMVKKYDVVCTNPPYSGYKNMNEHLRGFLKKIYPQTKTDLYAVFMEKGLNYAKPQGYIAMITMQNWMFLPSFEKFRRTLLDTTTIVNMLHLGSGAFEEISGGVVQTTAFVIQNEYVKHFSGEYFRLTEPKRTEDKRQLFFHIRMQKAFEEAIQNQVKE